MPPRLLLDGEDLRSLMVRVRDEMGPGARIVKAERIRTGGVGGFFAREHYELTVEVPEESTSSRWRRPVVPAPSTAPDGARSPVGIDALLAAADAEEQGATGAVRAGAASPDPAEPSSSQSPGSTTTPVDTSTPADPAAPQPSSPPDDVEASPPSPTVSTAGETFAQVLESMRQIVGVPQDEVVPAEEPAGHADQQGSAAATTSGTAPVPQAPAPEVAPPSAPDVPEDEPEPDDRSASTVTSLLELGIPARLLVGFADLDAPAPISRLVRRIDAAPVARLTPGNVIALVGDPAAALRTAMQMAHRAGLESRDIVLAGDMDAVAGHGRRLQTRQAVVRYRSRVSSEALYVVVVGVPSAPERWAEAAGILEALAPDQAWAVIDARRKAVELRRWMRVVGSLRRFDALAASSTFDAQAPGTVLNLGVPVGWIDGLPASPLVWAAVLSERLADDARWD